MPRRLLTILTVCGLSVLVARVGFAQSISDVIVTDHADSSAVITWATDAATSDNQVHYGTTSSLGLTALADGDSGETSGSSEAHRVVLDLSSSPGTPYFFRVSSDGIVEDNAGSLYSFTTAQLNISTTLHTVTGKVQDLTGQGLEGVLVVTTITGTTVAHPQSSLTNANGTWFLELNTLRNATTGIKQGFANGNSVAITYRGDGLRSGVDAHTLAQVDITGFDVVPTAQINGAPAPVAAAETTDEDTAFTITLVATDVDGDTPIYSLLDDALNPVTSMTTSAGATVTLSGDVATYTPLTDYATTVEADSFDFFASDGMVDGPSTTVFVTVNPVNDAPVFSLPDNHSGDEDFGAGSVTYSSIGPGGGADEESQTVGMSVVNNSPLIVDIVSSDDAGFTYTTVANASGEATIEVTATDNGPVGSNDVNTSSQTFTITVTAVNDPPVFDPVTSFAVNEDSGSGSVTYVGVGPGGGDDEIGQTVTMTAASLDQGIVEITGFDDAGFSYATLTDVNGPALITVTASDGQAENSTTTESLTITVNALNDAPTFTGPADVFLDEDPGQQTITISDLSPGGGDDESAGQDVTLAAESDDTSIIDTIVVSGDGATRVLTYTPVAEANGGPVYITLTATDNGPTGTDHVNTSSDIFLITVAAVDDPPTFTTPSATDTDEDSPQQSIPITDVGPGGGSDESGQTVTIFAASSDESIIPHPSVTTSGATRTLTYTPEPDASGDVDIELTVDDGTNEVIDTFTITVNAVNDPPTFTVPDDVTLSEDPGAQIITITDVDAGGGTHEDTQTVLVTVSGYDTSLIADIAVDGSGAEWALSFTPVTYANGSTSVTVTADDQQTENNLTTDTFTIEITPVNNKPVYDSVLPQTADEDAGPTEITVTGVGPGGGADEDLQDVTFTATTDNDGIVPDLAVSGEGDTRILTYTPVDDANGTVTIILTASDGQSENSTNAQAFTITVNSVNDEPTFDSVSTDPVDEDSGENFVTIAGIDPGGGTDESDQTVTFEAASDSPSIVPNPTITDGVLSFIPADDANGTVTITLTAMDNGEVAAPNDNTYSDTFTITVNAVDDAPTFDPVDDVQVNEDAGATEVAITGIGIGGGDFEPTQTVELIAKSDNESVVPSPGVFGEEDARTLTFNPEPDANGTAVITVTATDTGSDALPHENTFFRQFTIDVVAVDDAPVFDAIADIGVDEDFGSDSVTFEGVGPGGGSDESGQDVTMHVASEHEDIVEITSFDDTGFVYATLPDANGTATIVVTATDTGSDVSPNVNEFSRTFMIDVNAINDDPDFDVIDDVAVTEDSPATSITITGITPGGGVDEEGQNVTLTAESTDQSVVEDPVIDGDTLTFTPVANAIGSAEITVTAADDGSGVSSDIKTSSRTFTIAVTPIDDAPVFDTVSDIKIDEDSGSDSVTFEGVGPGGGSDESGQEVTFEVTSEDPDIVTIESFDTGELVYTTVADANGTATITVVATDTGDGDSPNVNTSSQTFTIDVAAINDAPTIDDIPTETVYEDAGATTVTLTGIGAGGGEDETGQELTVEAKSGDATLVEVSVAAGSGDTRTLTLTPLDNANGEAEITVTVTDDGDDGEPHVNATTATFMFVVEAVNDAPVFDKVTDQEENEDSGETVVTVTGIGPGGGADEDTQELEFVAESSDPTVVPDPTVTLSGDTAKLSFAPEADMNGTVTITLTAWDSGSDASPDVNTSSQEFTIVVNAVNDAPTFDTIADVQIDEDEPSTTIDVVNLNPGGGSDESTQKVFLSAESDTPWIISDIIVSGDSLIITPEPHANGLVEITVIATDEGSDVSPNVNSSSRTFTVDVVAVNDPPTIDIIADVNVDEDSGATDVSLAGVTPGGGADEAEETVKITAFSSHPSIVPDPAVSGTTLTFEPEPDANVATLDISAVTITVTADDGQSENATTVETFDIVVKPVNDFPTIDVVSTAELTRLDELLGVLVPSEAIEVALTGIGPSGGPDESGQEMSISASVTDSVSNSAGVDVLENVFATLTVYDEKTKTWLAVLSFDRVPLSGGTAVITVDVSDSQDSTPLHIPVHVHPVNPPPTFTLKLANGGLHLDEDAVGQVVYIEDIDAGNVDGDPLQTLTWAVESSDPTIIPTPTLTLQGTMGTIGFRPLPNANTGDVGEVTITVSATDDSTKEDFTRLTTSKTFTVEVTPINDEPVVSIVGVEGSTVPGGRNTPLTFEIAVTDVENDLTSVPVVVEVTGEPVGTYEFDSDALVVDYTPAADWTGKEVLVVHADDGEDITDFTVTIDVTNALPLAFAGSADALETQSTSVLLIASDPNGDAMTYSISELPKLGTLSGEGTLLTYTPNRQPTEGFVDTDTFMFVAFDGIGNSEPAPITITIVSENDPPTVPDVAVDPVEEGASVDVIVAGEDIDGDALTIRVDGEPQFGTFTGEAPNFVYTANRLPTNPDDPEGVVTETLTYFANDGLADSAAPGLITISILPINDAPVATDGSLAVEEGASATVDLVSEDADGDPLTFTRVVRPELVVLPVLGTVTLDGATATYTALRQPTEGFQATDTFQYAANDGLVHSETATIAVTITPVNTPPTQFAVEPAGTVETAVADPVTFALSAEDEDGDVVTFKATASLGGIVEITDGTAVYTSTATENVVETVVFTASDGVDQTAEISVAIDVTVANIPPIATPQDVAVAEDASVDIVLAGTDAENAPLTYSVATEPSLGALTGDAPNLLYTPRRQPTAGFVAQDSFTFNVNDGESDGETAATVSITIGDVNDPPVIAATAPGDVVEGDTVSITLEAEDIDGDPVTFAVVAQPERGKADVTGDTATYESARQAIVGFQSVDSFTVVARDDSNAESASATVDVTIAEINDPPTVEPKDDVVDEDGVVTIALTGQDPDGDPVTFLVAEAPANGQVVIDGSLATYTPNPDFSGTDGFTYVGTDGRDAGDPATVSVKIGEIPDDTEMNPDRALETVRALEGAEPVVIDLGGDNPLFTDVDSEPIISAASSDPTVVIADVTDSTLTLTFLSPGAAVITVSAETATGAAQFAVEVQDNLPPVFERPTPAFMIAGEEGPPYPIVARDPEDDPVTYSILLIEEVVPDPTEPQPDFSIDPQTGLLTGFVEAGTARVRNFALTLGASDGINDIDDPELGLRGTITSLLIKVRRPNGPPRLAVEAAISAPLDESISFDVVGSDDNITDTLTISASTRDANDALDAAIRAFNTADETLDGPDFVKTFSFTAAADIAGQEFTIRWAVNDGELGATAETVLVAGEITNLAPSIEVSTLLDVAEEGQELWSLSIATSDPEDDPLFFEVDSSNEQIVFDEAAGELTWENIDFDSDGSHLITVGVRDREDAADAEVKTAEVTITLVVFDVNREPVFDAIQPDVTVTKEDVVDIEATASDPDGEDVTLTVTGLPSWARVLEQTSGAQARVVVELAPTLDSETATFTVAAADAAGTKVEQAIVVTLDDPPNRDPILAALTSRNVEEGETLVVTVEASDPDGNELTLTAEPLPDGATFVDGVLTWEPERGASDNGEYDIVITADDGFGGTASDTLTVRVQPGKNRPPHLSQLPTLEIEEGGEGSIDLKEYSSDPDGDPTTVFLDTTELPGRIELVDGVLTVRPVEGDAGTHPILLRIEDDRGKSTARTIRVVVTGEIEDGFSVTGAFVDPPFGSPSDVFGFEVTVTNTARRAPDPDSVVLTLTLPDGSTRDIDMTGGKGNLANGVTYAAEEALTAGEYSFVVTGVSGEDIDTAEGSGPTVEAAEVVVSGVSVSGAAGTLRIGYLLENPNAGIGADVTVEYRTNGADWTPAAGASGELVGLSTGQYEAAWDTTIDLPDANGETVELQLTPTDGSPTLSDGFQLDNVPPGAPEVDEIAAFVSDPILIVSGQSDSPGAIAALKIDGLDSAEGDVDANGAFRVSTPALEDGEHTISVFIREPAADGPASAQQSVVVDSAEPIVTITSPETGAIVSTRTPVLTATVDAGLSQADVEVEMRLNGKVVASSFSPDEGVASFTPTELLVAGRVFLVSVSATKPSGASTVKASVFTVDPTAADETAPTGFGSSPGSDETIADPLPAIEGVVQDSESGVDPESIAVQLDGAATSFRFLPTDERNGIVALSVDAPLADGSHDVLLTFADVRGNEGTAGWAFTVDTTPPDAPVVGELPLATAEENLAVTGSAEAGAKVSVVVDGAVRAVSDADDSGGWTAAVTLTEDGPHFIETFAQDAVENTSELSEAVTVIVDRQGPRLSLITPTLGTASPQVLPLFEGVARDALSGIDPTAIVLLLDGIAADVGYDDALGTFSYQTPEPFENGATVSVVIQAADLAGNPSTLEGEVIFDARLADITPPVITAVKVNGQDAAAGGTVTIAEAEISVQLVVTDDLAGVESVVGVYDGQELAFTLEERVATFFTSPVEDGAHVLLVQATDKLGNVSAIQQFDIVRKGAAAAPVFDPVDPITNVATVSITGSGVDLGATVSVTVNGAPVETFVTDTTFATALVTLREGENTITATATDAVGNQAEAAPLTVTLDATPPEAFFVDPVPDSTTPATQDVISVSFTDAVGVEPTSVTLDVDGAPVTASVTTEGLTFQAPEPFSAGTDGDVGNHNAVVTLQDIAGNPTTKLLNFSVDGTPPRIEGLVPNEGEDVTRTDPLVSATIVGQDVDPDSVEMLVGPVDGTLENVVDAPNYDFIVTTGQINYRPELEDQTTYQVVVRVADLVGNPAEATWTFTIDTAAEDTTDPNVTVGFPQPGDSVNSAGLDILSFTTVDGSSGVDPDNVSLFLNDSQGDSPLILGQLEEDGNASFNRETGEARIFIRRILLIMMQDARGGFSFDPLELNSLERTLGGGGASFDPLELNSLERSLDSGDTATVASLERSLNTGANLLSTGTNEIGVQVTDLSGNVSFATWSFDVVLDPPQAPRFDGLPPATNQSNFTVTGLVPDLSGALPITIALRVNSSPVGVTEINDLAGVFSIPNVRLAEGENTLTATAQDSTGNVSDRSESFSIAVDLSPPTLRIDTAPGASAGETTRIAGRVSDERPEGVAALVVVVNGVETALDIAATFDATVALPAEENTLVVRATDAAGNVTESDAYTVTVDRTPPTTAPTGVTAVPTADARGLAVSWQADPNATTYNVYRSGVAIADATGLTPVGAQVSLNSYTDTALPAGSTVYYAVTSVDAAGNEDQTVVSDAFNVAWMRVQGGTASLADGTALVAPDRGLFTNVLRTAAVSFDTAPSGALPPLADSVEGSLLGVSVRAATGTITTFAEPATLTIPTSSTSATVYRLTGDEWVALGSERAAGGVSAQITSGGIYQLAGAAVEAIPGDVDGNRIVDIRDLVLVSTVFGQNLDPGDSRDLNGDGVVNIVDLVTVATNFGAGLVSAGAPALVSGSASVRLSLSANRVSANLGEVVVTAESAETIAGYEMRVSMVSPDVVMDGLEPGDILGSRAYWLPSVEDPTGSLLAGVRLDLAERVAGPSSGVVARFLVRSRGEVTAERLLDAVQLRDVRFSDPNGRLLTSRMTRSQVVTPNVVTALHANYPNPFNPETWIPYSLSEASEVSLRIYDARGGLTRTLELGRREAGSHLSRAGSAYWDGRNDLGEMVAGGVYYVELRAADGISTRRLVLSK